ncbi:MAG: preprotein translocase subunit SecE [Bifidobacteriaceae bacterium]|jgi:preprotein translocase subunit SecE|nr:preprotein translocase subunit SecE [Bifidobacteriaceae bacterium]
MANKAATTANDEGELKPNFFMRIGLFIKQIIVELRKVVAPTRKELFNWTVAVLIFVVLLMLFVTAMDFGLGKLVFLVFG